MKEILYVCTGNTCRSPMAEAITNDRLTKENLERAYIARSAGLLSMYEDEASPEALVVCGNHGLDISGHKSRSLNEDDVRNACLILTMTKTHKQQVCAIYKEFRQKVFTLCEFVAIIRKDYGLINNDVCDPFGCGYAVYENTYNELEGLIVDLVEYLKGGNEIE